MNNITEITRRDIFDLFQNGYVEDDWLNGKSKISYLYYGRLTEIEFLKKLYPLDKMSSSDSRFLNAEGDIWQHTVNNNDWDSDWIFKDDRFELLRGSDIILLNFLCAVFHPENRFEKGYWHKYFEKINNFIKTDGYELYESEKISGRTVYSWRKISSVEISSGKFMPFSVRNRNAIDVKSIKLPTITKKVRSEFLDLFNRYNEIQNRTTDTGWNYSISLIEAFIKEDIFEYYTPKAFDTAGKYSEADDFEQFILNNQPYCVFDAIELFAQYNNQSNFADEVNYILQNNRFIYKLVGGKIQISHIKLQTEEIVKELGLKEIIEQATLLYNSGKDSDKQFAVEKLWDAFERLKTYYFTLDKKESVAKIISEISNENDSYKNLFEEEFRKLTAIGNDFRIRHHETTKIDIKDSNHYDYFYKRCFALVDLALKYLK